jgi:hypothetical protein
MGCNFQYLFQDLQIQCGAQTRGSGTDRIRNFWASSAPKSDSGFVTVYDLFAAAEINSFLKLRYPTVQHIETLI